MPMIPVSTLSPSFTQISTGTMAYMTKLLYLLEALLPIPAAVLDDWQYLLTRPMARSVSRMPTRDSADLLTDIIGCLNELPN